MEEAFYSWAFSNNEVPIVGTQLEQDFRDCFEAGVNWQASLVTEEKILEIMESKSRVYTLKIFGSDKECECVPVGLWKEVAKEIIALIKGHDEK